MSSTSKIQAWHRHRLEGELLTEILRCHGKARLRVTGTSMLPSFFPGDLLTVRRAEISQVLPGEIVLFTRDGRFFVHRVATKSRAGAQPALTTRGDSLSANDPPVLATEFLGRVTTIIRNSQSIVPPGRLSLWQRLFGLLSRVSDLPSRVLVHWHVRRCSRPAAR